MVILSGCSSAAMKSIKLADQESDRRYRGAYAKCNNDEKSLLLETKINLLLKQDGLFNKELSINCRVHHFNKGNRFVRYMLGGLGGAGKANTLTTISILENDVREIVSFDIEGELSIGVFGGDSDSMLDETAEQIINYLKENHLEKEKR